MGHVVFAISRREPQTAFSVFTRCPSDMSELEVISDTGFNIRLVIRYNRDCWFYERYVIRTATIRACRNGADSNYQAIFKIKTPLRLHFSCFMFELMALSRILFDFGNRVRWRGGRGQ